MKKKIALLSAACTEVAIFTWIGSGHLSAGASVGLGATGGVLIAVALFVPDRPSVKNDAASPR